MFRLWKEANVKKNGQVTFRTKLKAQSAVNSDKKKRNTESPHSPSHCNDGSDQSMKRQRVDWEALKIPDLEVELRRRRLMVGDKRAVLVLRLNDADAQSNPPSPHLT